MDLRLHLFPKSSELPVNELSERLFVLLFGTYLLDCVFRIFFVALVQLKQLLFLLECTVEHVLHSPTLGHQSRDLVRICTYLLLQLMNTIVHVVILVFELLN